MTGTRKKSGKKTAAKKAPTKKAVGAKSGTKRTAVKAKTTTRPAAKKASAPTATDQVLKIIKRFKKGVGVATLKERTGFKDKKIRDILFRAAKQGKIKRVAQGIYVSA